MHDLQTVLVVDDDPALRQAVARALALEGYDVVQAADGRFALDAVVSRRPDAIVLDVGLPGTSGLAVCETLRARGDDTPILVLTARGDVRDRVQGLDAGADDFMAKPFALEELFARIRALLRRSGRSGESGDRGARLAAVPTGQETSDHREYRIADLRLDSSARRVWRGDREIELTKTEFDLLELLVRNAGLVLDRSIIHERIWGYDFGPDSKNLTVFIGYLRAKTESGGEPRLLHTVRGVGYVARAS